MSDKSLPSSLEEFIKSLSLDLYGYAAVQDLFAGRWASWPQAISLGVALPEAIMKEVLEGPTAEYYDHYQLANARLNRQAKALEQWLKDHGYNAEAFPATVTSQELNAQLGKALTAPVQHKTVATRAGLGWIGKSGLLITQHYGPRVRLVTVFTDMPLPSAQPIEDSRCGSCMRCVRACPAQAIRGTPWHIGVPREELVDVWACKQMAEQLMQERVGRQDAVCGICIAVCPFAGLSKDVERSDRREQSKSQGNGRKS